MPEELHELHEQAEEARHNQELLPVTFTMAILAVLVALVTLMGHRAHTHETIMQIKANDTWLEYQSKKGRGHADTRLDQVLSLLKTENRAKTAEVRDEFEREANKYRKDDDTLQQEAKNLENEVIIEQRKADRFDFGEALLEMGLVVTSICLMTRRMGFWYFGMLFAAIGVVSAITGYLIH